MPNLTRLRLTSASDTTYYEIVLVNILHPISHNKGKAYWWDRSLLPRSGKETHARLIPASARFPRPMDVHSDDCWRTKDWASSIYLDIFGFLAAVMIM
jgi:hypothetical protein